MSEQKIPIPAMLYNAAVGGHVCGAVDIIDEALGLEQSSINEDVASMPYNDGNPNGMGRIILKKTDNFKNIVEAQSGNTIFIIKYDFTLTGNVTIPANCVLEFEGGSISGAYTITGNNTSIQADLVKIFNNDVTFGGSWNVTEAYPEWFGAKGDRVTDDTSYIQKTVSSFSKIVLSKIYFVTSSITISSNTTIIGINNSKLYSDKPNQFFTIDYNQTSIVIDSIKMVGVGEGYPTHTSSTARQAYLCKILDNCSNITIKNCLFKGGTGGIFILQGCKDVRIINNKFEDMLELLDSISNPTQAFGGYGVVCNEAYNSGEKPSNIEDITSNVIVNGNIFKNIQRHVFYIQLAKDIRFCNNIIKESIINAIGTEHTISDCGTMNFIISGNVNHGGLSFYQFYDYRPSSLRDIPNNIVIEKNCIDVSYIAIRFHNSIMENCIIQNNQFKANSGFVYTNGTVKKIIIQNNIINASFVNSAVSFIGHAPSAKIYSLKVLNNIFCNNDVNNGVGISLSYVDTIEELIISHNTITEVNRSIDIGDIGTVVNKLYIIDNVLPSSNSSSIRFYSGNKLKNAIIKNNLVDKAVSVAQDLSTNVVVEDNYVIV